MDSLESGLSLERGSVLGQHGSGGNRHNEEENSSHEIGGKGQKTAPNQPQITRSVMLLVYKTIRFKFGSIKMYSVISLSIKEAPIKL